VVSFDDAGKRTVLAGDRSSSSSGHLEEVRAMVAALALAGCRRRPLSDMAGWAMAPPFFIILCVIDMWVPQFFNYFLSNCHVSVTWDET
jgi:hypothetical protein